MQLVFSGNPAVGAYGVNPSYYQITSLDDIGADPAVSAALVVPGSPTNVELALAADLVPGGRYTLTAVGVPAQSGPATTNASTEVFTFGNNFKVPNQEPEVDASEILLYGRDLVWNGTDFQETATGDLATISGSPNAIAALERRALSEGLSYDPGYGAKPRQYVDGVAIGTASLRTVLIEQMYQDDRVKKADVDYIPDEDTFVVSATLVGNKAASDIKVNISSQQ